MSENNKSYRIKTNVGSEYNGELRFDVNLLQDYDEFEILSLKVGTENLYKYHTSHYGCVVGRVLANGGVGVPNVKISSFIPVEDIDTSDPVFSFLYPYTSTRDKNRDDIRYNLLTDTKIDNCHQAIGTFPNKRLVLDDNNVIEIYDKYYKFTTTTNGSGDYMLFGLPVGNNIIHSDLDLSDIGFLSQKPRDLFYKGYTAKQFENASQFKKDTNLDNLTQVISQDSSVYVFPFWGDEIENEGQIKIVRNDIDVNYKFEPTCIFIGCIVSDEKSNAISKNCIPHERMGKMDRLTTGAGTIEMIRKTVSGDIESIAIQGNSLIDGNGTWCYQIPMNLDYVSTDEYGNLVPTDDYNKGLPTRTNVRFRVSLADYESDYENAHLVKVLVPNNPEILTRKENGVTTKSINYDYEFGSATKDESFKDLFWNNVYTVKSYIPRFQKGNRQRNKNFTGFKAVNVNGANNPIPYNNMRINLTFLFVFQCLIFKSLVLIVKTLNKIITVLNSLSCNGKICGRKYTCAGEEGLVYLTLDGGMCPALDGQFIAPGATDNNQWDIITHTYKNVYGEEYGIKYKVSDATYNDPPDGKYFTQAGTALIDDNKSADGKNSEIKTPDPNDPNEKILVGKKFLKDDVKYGEESSEDLETMKIYNTEDYFVKCVELQFAMEYEVIQFDFYNDWINGMIYIPRWFAEVRKNKDRAHYCGNTFTGYRMLTQQCAVGYDSNSVIENNFQTGCRNGKQQCHKRFGRKQVKIFGNNRGIVTAQKNSRGQYAYYLRPSELFARRGADIITKANLFSTDVVLLGSVLDCNQYGIPSVDGYTSSSYKMPPPTAEIISDTQEMDFNSDADPKKAAVLFLISYVKNTIRQLISENINEEYIFEPCDLEEYTKKAIYAVAGMSDATWRCRVPNNTDLNGVIEIANRLIADQNKRIILPSGLFVEYDEKYNELEIDKVIVDIREIILKKISEYESTLSSFKRRSETGCQRCVRSHCNTCETDKTYRMFETVKSTIFLKIKNSDELKTGKLKEIYNNYYKSYYENDIAHFYMYNKKDVQNAQLDDEPVEITYSELSGIDWGYNPFEVGQDDDTTKINKQIAGHFLEIGCTFSLSNIKSCVNLQRVCEIGGEISQSHYYYDSNNKKWNLLDPTGIIAKREVIDAGIRTTFATLNSQKLGVIYDKTNGYKKYNFTPYNPVSFMGDLKERKEDIGSLTGTTGVLYENYGLIENQSISYKAFRFGTTSNNTTDKFLIKDKDGQTYFMPQYENSFYFYFGLKDGNTAIDRLYNEYYAPCSVNYDVPEVTFTVIGEVDRGFNLHYSTQNMSSIKSITVKFEGRKLTDSEFEWDKKNSTITVSYIGQYSIRLKDTSNQVVKSIVNCTENDYRLNPEITYGVLVRKVLNDDDKWRLEYKEINCDVTDFKIDNRPTRVTHYVEQEWYDTTFEYEPNSEHKFEFIAGGKTVYSNTITFNESIEIENMYCEDNICYVSYKQKNTLITNIESDNPGALIGIDYMNKILSINSNSNNKLRFKNYDESVIIKRTINTN